MGFGGEGVYVCGARGGGGAALPGAVRWVRCAVSGVVSGVVRCKVRCRMLCVFGVMVLCGSLWHEAVWRVTDKRSVPDTWAVLIHAQFS